MGTGRRIRPERLGEKLKAIRENLGLTTDELIVKLDCPTIPLYRASITQYEKNRREPALIVLLSYGRLAQIPVDVLIDDRLDLPLQLNVEKYSMSSKIIFE
jgi:transcriptional regulator with XRE-family HTH domain